MKYCSALLFLAVSALAQPAFVASQWCSGGTPCVMTEPAGYASAYSFRVSLQTNVVTRRWYVKCGTSSGNYAYQHEHHKDSTQASIDKGGVLVLFGGVKPETTYYCVAGASVNTDGTGGSVESGEFTYATPSAPADHADNWTEIPSPTLPDTLTMPTPTVTYNVAADCSDLQAQWDAMKTAHAGAPDVNREIVIPAGAVCAGPLKEWGHTTGTGWVIVRSSAVGTNSFPPAGVRLDPVSYQSQMVRIQNSTRVSTPGAMTTNALKHSVYDTDGSSRIWHAGIIFEAAPAVDVWVPKTATCTPGSGAPVTISNLENGSNHYLANGNRVKITSSSNASLLNNSYTISGVTAVGSNFTLDGTEAVTGSAAACTISILADMKLANCGPGTGGVIRCNTVDASNNSVQHGLVTGQIVKVASYDTVKGDWISYTGTYGFGGRTSTANAARSDAVTVVDDHTVEFQGRTPNGTYEGGARLIADGPIVGFGYYNADSPIMHHVVFDRTWFHTRGIQFRENTHIRYACSGDCLLRDSVVDPNVQWVFVKPTPTSTVAADYDVRSFSTMGNGYNINIDRWWKSAAINNLIGYSVLGLAAASGNTTYPIPSNVTVQRNTFYYPDEFRFATDNPNANGMTVTQNRQPVEFKAGEYLKIDSNRFFGIPAGQDHGAGVVLASRPNVESMTGTDVNKNRIFGIALTNNTVLTNGVGFEFIGSNTSDAMGDGPGIRRVMIRNNIIATDGNRYIMNDGQFFGAGMGRCFEVTHGMEGITVDHNLCLQRGTLGAAIVAGVAKSAGYRVTNNIITAHTLGASSYPLQSNANSYEVTPIAANLAWGTTSWQQWTRGMLNLGSSVAVTGGTSAGTYNDLDASLVFANNAFITGVRGSNPPNSYDSSTTGAQNTTLAQCKTDLGGFIDSANFPNNICWDAGASIGSGKDTWFQREAAAGFLNWNRTIGAYVPGRAYDFHLKYNSPFKSGATSALNSLCDSGLCLKSSDGTDLGPNIEALESSQGLVKNARVLSITTTGATVAYLAPDSAACSVDYWKGSDTPSRVADGGGPRVRNVALSGLSGGTQYKYIVQCAVEQPSGSFTTR